VALSTRIPLCREIVEHHSETTVYNVRQVLEVSVVQTRQFFEVRYHRTPICLRDLHHICV
jgi:hypothetical protein